MTRRSCVWSGRCTGGSRHTTTTTWTSSAPPLAAFYRRRPERSPPASPRRDDGGADALGLTARTTPRRPAHVTLKHPKAAHRPAHDLSIAPLFSMEGRRIPRHELPDSVMAPDLAYQI